MCACVRRPPGLASTLPFRVTRYTFEWTPRLVEGEMEFLLTASDVDAQYKLQSMNQDQIPEDDRVRYIVA